MHRLPAARLIPDGAAYTVCVVSPQQVEQNSALEMLGRAPTDSADDVTGLCRHPIVTSVKFHRPDNACSMENGQADSHAEGIP